MTAAIVPIARITTLLLAAGAAVSVVLGEQRFALGMVLTGALTLASMGLTVWGTRGMVDPRRAGPGASSLLLGLKLPMVCGGVWLLVQSYPPLSVALGGLALVAGSALYASASLLVPNPARRV